MKNLFKNNIKIIFAFVLGSILTGSIVYAAIIASSDQVSFTPSNSNWKVSNVKTALDDLYTNAQNNYYTGYNAGKSSVSLTGDALESHVLPGKTFYSNSTTKLTGKMPSYSKDYTGKINVNIDVGYHSAGQCKLADAYNSGVTEGKNSASNVLYTNFKCLNYEINEKIASGATYKYHVYFDKVYLVYVTSIKWNNEHHYGFFWKPNDYTYYNYIGDRSNETISDNLKVRFITDENSSDYRYLYFVNNSSSVNIKYISFLVCGIPS